MPAPPLPSPVRRPVRSGRLVTDVVVAGVLVALVCVPVWPGVFSVDSQAIYRMGIEGDVNTWYSPTLAWLWGRADASGIPVAGALVAAVAALVVALLAVYRLVLGPAASRVATAGTVLWPPVYGLLGWVGRDVWFAALLLTVVALLGWAALLPARRRVLVAAALVPAWFALDARQNGFPVLAVMAGVGAWWAWWALVGRRWRAPVALGAALLAVVLGAGLQLGVIAAIDAERLYPEQYLYYEDLFAVSFALDRSQLPPSLFPSQDLDELRRRRETGVPFDGPDGLVAIADGEPDAEIAARIGRAWREMVRNHPLDYLAARGRLYAEQLGIGRPAQGTYFSSTFEMEWYASERLRQSFPELNARRLDLLARFDGGPPATGGPLHAVWVYLLLGLGGAAVLALVRGPLRVLGVTALLLQLTLQGVLVIASPAALYRFQLFQVVLGMALAVTALASVAAPRESR